MQHHGRLVVVVVIVVVVIIVVVVLAMVVVVVVVASTNINSYRSNSKSHNQWQQWRSSSRSRSSCSSSVDSIYNPCGLGGRWGCSSDGSSGLVGSGRAVVVLVAVALIVCFVTCYWYVLARVVTLKVASFN